MVAVGFSLPAEPLRFPQWCWDALDAVAPSYKLNGADKLEGDVAGDLEIEKADLFPKDDISSTIAPAAPRPWPSEGSPALAAGELQPQVRGEIIINFK